ncbi:lysozyme inhibitor LprI family protein [Brunnivagina elsteri]|uniref:Lysozyme inhibitor LprI-like N-terminal domain-containing protein n=1 Tax=Brunnivagina elsteri CCALA 953 TaxID=987040 RepID=A0A2A2TML9_9CYAN|nr:lysozyme inhibitor LprI family protein [Calothrix elsteri]PAX59703.1 hypothetical protein CK510_05740 [Calothrix elsteri CCALA 953]
MKLHLQVTLLLLTGLLLGTNITPGLAYPQKISQTLPPPNCKNPQTTRDTIECGRSAYREANKKLINVYKQLQSKLGGTQKKRLIVSQESWVKYRDTSCAFEGGMYEGGSLEPPTRINCYAKVTNQRLIDLDVWLQQLNRR